MPSIILASASPSRKRLLEAAGVNAQIVISDVNEEDSIYLSMTPKEMVIALAIVKAHTVRGMINGAGLIIACDSTFEFEGTSLGKPLNPQVAKDRARMLSGKSGYLHTGHCILDTERGVEVADIATTKVNFSELTGFTLDGLSSAFISSIEGDYTNVIGLSVPLLRRLTSQLGYPWHEITHQAIGAH
jgi:septum formation protein